MTDTLRIEIAMHADFELASVIYASRIRFP
jgi:hypothetical protein